MTGQRGPSASIRVCTVSAGGSGRVADLVKRTGSEAALQRPTSGPESQTAVILVPTSPSTLPSADTVHDVVDALADLGWSRVVVGGALSHRETDLGLTDVEGVLADAAYPGNTHAARRYERADLSRAMTESACPPSSLLSGVPVSAEWAQAGLRVVVARWAPDVENAFRACIAALSACAADVPGAAPADVCADVALHFPPAFTIVEAAGAVDDAATPTLIAASDIVSTDVVSAVLHGVDPTASATVGACVRLIGLPENLQLDQGVAPLAPRRAETRVADDTFAASVRGCPVRPGRCGFCCHPNRTTVTTATTSFASSSKPSADSSGPTSAAGRSRSRPRRSPPRCRRSPTPCPRGG